MYNLFPTNDAWDWPYIIYAGTVILNRVEQEIWDMRPRTFQALMNVHKEIQEKMWSNKTKKQNTTAAGYIDNIPGW